MHTDGRCTPDPLLETLQGHSLKDSPQQPRLPLARVKNDALAWIRRLETTDPDRRRRSYDRDGEEGSFEGAEDALARLVEREEAEREAEEVCSLVCILCLQVFSTCVAEQARVLGCGQRKVMCSRLTQPLRVIKGTTCLHSGWRRRAHRLLQLQVEGLLRC